MLTSCILLALIGADAEGVSLKFVASDASVKAGGYRPLRAEMDGKPDAVKKAPEGLTAPKYGTLKIGDKQWQFILDEPEGAPAKLFVDTNGDGDLTNDPETTWSARKTGNLTMYQGKSKVDLGDGQVGSLGMYRFDPNDPQRAQLKNTMMFYTDYGFQVTLKLDDKEFTSFVSGALAPNVPLAIDRDGNGQISYKREMISVGKPFNFTGTTYVLAVKDNKPVLEKAAEALPLAPLPPDLSIGKKAVEFKMTATDGTVVEFPKTYAGKLVMLDFWATWCGPCIAELPNVKKAYEKWHGEGFEILGISLDRKDDEEKLASFTKKNEMPWPQLFDGKAWSTEIGELYDVSAIPFVLLVDGDTGEILATAQQLRGPGLSDFIEKALAKKKASL